nr:hypothetical protein [Granulosicoccus sp.]
MFIGRFEFGNYDGRIMLVHLTSHPKAADPPSIEVEIEQISPSFGEIFKQAKAAEDYELFDIAGVGYRKALEFLIKDYCIGKDPDNADVVKRKLLGRVIADHVSDANVKQCARFAAWLGNDETHYERRWVDKDIDDLKTLIRLTCNWIVSAVLTEQYSNEMDEATN